MTDNLRFTLLVVVLSLMVMVLTELKKKSIMTKYALLWILSSIAMLISICFPILLEEVSIFLGFEKTSNMIFLIGFFILFCIVFGLTMIISKQKKEIIALIQQVSILTYRYESDEEKK